MKLRHKTFILIFAATILLIGTAGCLLLRFYVGEKIDLNVDRAYKELTELTDELDSFIIQYRSDQQIPILSAVESETAFGEFFVSKQVNGWITLPDQRRIGNMSYESDIIPEKDSAIIKYHERDGVILASAVVHFENGDNILYLLLPAEEIDQLGCAAILFAITLLISLTCSAIGTLASARFEKKLTRMNLDATKALGSRDARFPKYGEKELDRLALSLNARSDSASDDMEKLQTIADGRKQFTDNLAHEMKTPLTSILGFADILRIRRSLDDRTRMEYANIIFEEARRMRGLSGKLLELATAGNTKLDFENVELSSFFDEIRLSVLPLLAPRSITLKVFPAPIRIKVDRELFKSLIYNLVENAAKASPDGAEIRLICEATPETVKISVSDDGCGMTSDQIRRATEPFYMADKSRSRKAGGAGLGLALCAEIAEKHRARMVIQSKQGRGTTVTLIMLTVLAQSEGGVTDEIN